MSVEHALVLPVGQDLYALPLDWVREVVAVPVLTPLVTAPSVVLGLFNLRGQIVPLLDTGALLGTGTTETAELAVVVDCPQGLAGLATTGLPQRHELDAPTGPSELPGTSGQYRVAERVVTLLDPAVLLSPQRISGQDPRVDLAVNGST